MSRGKQYTTVEAASYTGMTVSTLRTRLSRGLFPEPHKQGRTNIWFVDELDAYNREHVTDYDVVHVLAS